ncbi:MAG: hypothetical protein PHD15_01060 [Clostridia bacterium]|nr:hypothetical protein [Clostridia bacterium]MDD4386339.1 hypothetical protein [Clostridia bacterium]
MINVTALIGSLIGVIFIFIFVALFYELVKKKLQIESLEIWKRKNISEIFQVEGVLNAPGCWIFSIIFIIIYFLFSNQENLIKYIILSIILNLAFQSLLGFINSELDFVIKDSEIILLSVSVTLIAIVFFTFPSIYIKLVVLGIILLTEFNIIYREFTGIWDSLFDLNFYTLEDIFLLYTPPMALFIAIFITLF